VFQKEIAEDLTLRDRTGASLLATALMSGDLPLAEQIRDHPKFDLAEQDPAQCIAAVARAATRPREVLEFVSKLPGIDLNGPLPHGVNGFPDLFSRFRSMGRPRDMTFSVQAWYSSHREILHEGVPAICASQFRLVYLLLGHPAIDPNQRGKHGETFLFHFDWPAEADLSRVDVNARDRHGNTALACAVLSRFDSLVPELIEKKCELTTRNENGDTMDTIIQNRARRARVGAKPCPSLTLRSSVDFDPERKLPKAGDRSQGVTGIHNRVSPKFGPNKK
jgi:ankyrin repeat protein